MARNETPLVPDFPGNSKTTHIKPDPEEKRVVKKVIKGNVTRQKKSASKRFSESFFGDSLRSTWDYVWNEVLVQAAKAAFEDMITGGTRRMLYGDDAPTHRAGSRRGSETFFDYRGASTGRSGRAISRNSQGRARHNFDDIIFTSRAQAEEVMFALSDLVIDYGVASVADMYRLAGASFTPTDNRWGWDALDGTRVCAGRGRNQWVIDLPRAIPID